MDKKALRKKKTAVLLGGKSSEREVSLKSGTAVYNALKARKYNVVAIDAGDDLCAALKKEKIELAFIALHGGHGENGAVQGLLEIMKIPYTGSGVLSSAVAMDKEASKKIFHYHGIPMPPFIILNSDRILNQGRRRPAPAFAMPWVVKPAAEGSSVGVEIVKTRPQFVAALKQAFSYGDRVIVEKYIAGQEVQIGILNNKPLGGVEVKPSLEFYNYEAKYTAGLTEYIFPPRLDRKTAGKAEEIALAAHKALGCKGATRVDLIIDAGKNPYVLEVNTIPGMTETSLLPKIAKNAGLEFPDLLEELLGETVAD